MRREEFDQLHIFQEEMQRLFHDIVSTERYKLHTCCMIGPKWWPSCCFQNGGPLGGAPLGAQQKSKQHVIGDIYEPTFMLLEEFEPKIPKAGHRSTLRSSVFAFWHRASIYVRLSAFCLRIYPTTKVRPVCVYVFENNACVRK